MRALSRPDLLQPTAQAQQRRKQRGSPSGLGSRSNPSERQAADRATRWDPSRLSPLSSRHSRRLPPDSSPLFLCRLSQLNPKPPASPTPAPFPFLVTLPRSGGGGADMGALSASTSSVNWLVEDDILLKNAVEVIPPAQAPCVPNLNFLSPYCWSRRVKCQLKRLMLFLSYF